MGRSTHRQRGSWHVVGSVSCSGSLHADTDEEKHAVYCDLAKKLATACKANTQVQRQLFLLYAGLKQRGISKVPCLKEVFSDPCSEIEESHDDQEVYDIDLYTLWNIAQVNAFSIPERLLSVLSQFYLPLVL